LRLDDFLQFDGPLSLDWCRSVADARLQQENGRRYPGTLDWTPFPFFVACRLLYFLIIVTRVSIF
jgi:hypothetical protein